MLPPVFEALVEELSNVSGLDDLPERIQCADCYILRDLPNGGERRKWLRKAKAEIIRRAIQERVDEIAEARELEDEILVQILLDAFPKDLQLYKKLTPAQQQMWIDKAGLAACGRGDEVSSREPLVYFISAEPDLIKIGCTTNLSSRLRSLRTAHPNELRILLAMPGSRDDEQELHRRFAEFRVGREWFRRSKPIDDYIASKCGLRAKSDLEADEEPDNDG
jgi:hypothetical protein